jgi:hypothetical protein
MLGNHFRETRSRCIEYEGRTVCLYDEFEVPPACRLRLRFESWSSDWRQGVFLGDMTQSSRHDTGLRLALGGARAPGLFLWADTSPSEVEIAVTAPRGVLHVYNVWDVGDGQRRSQLQGAGMLIEPRDGGRCRRYRCNDGHAEPTFTYLVFTLTIESQ